MFTRPPCKARSIARLMPARGLLNSTSHAGTEVAPRRLRWRVGGCSTRMERGWPGRVGCDTRAEFGTIGVAVKPELGIGVQSTPQSVAAMNATQPMPLHLRRSFRLAAPTAPPEPGQGEIQNAVGGGLLTPTPDKLGRQGRYQQEGTSDVPTGKFMHSLTSTPWSPTNKMPVAKGECRLVAITVLSRLDTTPVAVWFHSQRTGLRDAAIRDEFGLASPGCGA